METISWTFFIKFIGGYLDLLQNPRLKLKSKSLTNHFNFFNRGRKLKYARFLVLGFLVMKLVRLLLNRPSVIFRSTHNDGVLFLLHDRQDLLSIVEKNSYFADVDFILSRSRKFRNRSKNFQINQAMVPSFSIISKYLTLNYNKILLNQFLSIRGAKYIADVVMQASIMEVNNLINIPKIYSFGYLHAGGTLLTEYTASVDRTLYSVQHGYLFENPVLNNLHAVSLIEDGADKILTWTSNCIEKYRIAFSETESKTPDMETLELDQVIKKKYNYKSGRVIMLMTDGGDDDGGG